MAREAEKAGRDTGKAKTESPSKTEGSPATRSAGGAGKSAATAGADKSAETNAGKTAVKEFQGERHKELQAALGKRSEDGADMPAIVNEFAALWLPLHMVEVELLVPELEDADIDQDIRGSVAVRRDLLNILLADLIQSGAAEGANAKLEALSEVLDAIVAASQQEAEAIIGAVDEATLSELGPEMKTRYERLKERFADIEENIGEAMNLLAPRSLSVFSRRQPGRRGEGRRESEIPRSSSMPDRDEQGRFTSEDERRYSRSGGSYRAGQERDPEGRYASEGRRSHSRYENEDEGRSSGRRSMDRERDEDDGGRYAGRSSAEYGSRWSGEGRGRSQSGWHGDPEGHSEASRRGWERSDRRESGWYGDPERHSEASRRGWEEGHRSQRRDEDDRYGRRDEDGGRYRRSSGDEDDGRRGGYGGRYESRRGGRDADDERYEGSSRSRAGHSGWSGDPEGHAEAARRGWEHRR